MPRSGIVLGLSTGTVGSARHLSPSTKRRELARWKGLRLSAGTKSGDPDPDIYPLCDRLNALPGVCTLQSCAGHRNGNVLDSGHLWLWLDRRTAERFDRNAWALAAFPTIERVARFYSPSGQEITVIEFQGNERGALATSADVIRLFFESLYD